MPAWREIHSDDFSSYASDADVEAAYTPPSDYQENGTDWGAAAGPDGQAGIQDQAIAPANDSGIIRKAVNPECRAFRVSGRWDFSAPNAVLTVHGFLHIDESNVAFNALLVISRVHASATLRVTLKTTQPYATNGGPVLWFHQTDVAGVLPSGVPAAFEVQGEWSTIEESSPGVFAPNTDGWVKTFLNGVEQTSFAGPVWSGDSAANPTPYWSEVNILTIGKFSEWHIYDTADCDESAGGTSGRVDNSVPCICPDRGSGPGGTTTGPILPPDPTQPLPPWIASCGFGGMAPNGTDPVYSENWAVL